MSNLKLQNSSQYPEEYGDFAIQSSDGVVCHFPSQILSHMSPMFQDMLALGKGASTSNESPVQITEPIESLELFLKHLDPRVIKPPIDSKTIIDLLAMAHKYQTNTVMDWFDQEATTERRPIGASMQEPFVTTEPVICLSLAFRYDLCNTGRCALRELCGLEYQRLLAAAPQLGLSAFLEILKLREIRIRRYRVWIDILSKHRPSGELLYQQDGESPRFWVYDRWITPCTMCITQRSQWIVGITSSVQLEPTWASFIHAYENNSRHCFSWGDFFEDLVPAWEEAALREESYLPDWPGGDL